MPKVPLTTRVVSWDQIHSPPHNTITAFYTTSSDERWCVDTGQFDYTDKFSFSEMNLFWQNRNKLQNCFSLLLFHAFYTNFHQNSFQVVIS